VTLGRKSHPRDRELDKAKRAAKVSEKHLERVVAQTDQVLELGERLAYHSRVNHYSEKIDDIYRGN
jgi:hypothetical protein